MKAVINVWVSPNSVKTKYFTSVLLASIQCQSVLTEHFFRHEPWHLGVDACIGVPLSASLIRLTRWLSGGVVLWPQPCLVQWRLEEFITHHYIWWAVLTVLQRWQIIWEAAKKTNITPPPFTLLVFFSPYVPPSSISSLSTLNTRHGRTMRLRASVAWNICRHGKCCVCELGATALKMWMCNLCSCAYWWGEKDETHKMIYRGRNIKRASIMTPQPPFLPSALSNLIILTRAKGGNKIHTSYGRRK